jgi:hypothetical protein
LIHATVFQGTTGSAISASTAGLKGMKGKTDTLYTHCLGLSIKVVSDCSISNRMAMMILDGDRKNKRNGQFNSQAVIHDQQVRDVNRANILRCPSRQNISRNQSFRRNKEIRQIQ